MWTLGEEGPVTVEELCLPGCLDGLSLTMTYLSFCQGVGWEGSPSRAALQVYGSGLEARRPVTLPSVPIRPPP